MYVEYGGKKRCVKSSAARELAVMAEKLKYVCEFGSFYIGRFQAASGGLSSVF